MALERTLIIFKPDCMEKRHVGSVLARFEVVGFSIVACKMARLQASQLREHYAHVASLPFYPDIENFMSRAPVVIMGLEGDNIVARVRELLGPTDSRKAAKGTIRGDFGTDIERNATHGSDAPETAKIEIAYFFNSGEIQGVVEALP